MHIIQISMHAINKAANPLQHHDHLKIHRFNPKFSLSHHQIMIVDMSVDYHDKYINRCILRSHPVKFFVQKKCTPYFFIRRRLLFKLVGKFLHCRLYWPASFELQGAEYSFFSSKGHVASSKVQHLHDFMVSYDEESVLRIRQKHCSQ